MLCQTHLRVLFDLYAHFILKVSKSICFVQTTFRKPLPAISSYFHRLSAISNHSSGCKPFLAVLIHFRPFQPFHPCPAMSSHFQKFQPFPAISCHFQPFQLFLVIYSHFQKFQPFLVIYSQLQLFPAIESH